MKRHRPDRCGIYIITSPSGGVYVGSTLNFPARWRQHLHALRRGTHSNPKLLNAWKKYAEQLVFRPLLICRREDLLFFEQRAIDILHPKYNVDMIAGSRLGCKLSEAHCLQMSIARKGIPMAMETRQKLSEANKGQRPWIEGRHHSPETREKIGAAARGRVTSEETKKKLSEKAKARPIDLERLAKAHAAAAIANRGRTVPPELREKIRLKLLGRPRSDITKEKISAANKGRVQSQQEKDNRKAAMVALSKRRQAGKVIYDLQPGRP